MAMDRTDWMALGGSVAAHVALFAALGLSLTNPVAAPPEPTPIAVDLIADVDMSASAPMPADVPAQMRGEEAAPIAEDAAAQPAPPLPAPAEPTRAEPTRAEPTPAESAPAKAVPAEPAPATAKAVTPPKPAPQPAPPRPDPRLQPKPAPSPKPTPVPARAPNAKPTPARPAPSRPAPSRPAAAHSTPARAAPTRPASKSGRASGSGASATATRPRSTGALDSLVGAVGRVPARSMSTGAPGKSAAQIRQSISTSIGGQVRQPWNRCRVSGVDVSDLITTVKFQLGRDGRLAGFTAVSTSGQNDSNRFQVARHQECAKDAIEAASPFSGLPVEHYEYWRSYEFRFKKD